MSVSRLINILGDGNAGSTDISGGNFNTSTQLKYTIGLCVESTIYGHVIYYSGNQTEQGDGGLYITSTRASGTAYGINMTQNIIYKLVNTNFKVYDHDLYTVSMVPDTPQTPVTYTNSRVNMIQSITVDPLTQDIYFWCFKKLNDVGYVMVIPYDSHVNRFTNTTLETGKLTMLYKIDKGQGSYSMAFHPDGHLFIGLFGNGKLLVFPGIGNSSTITLYGFTITTSATYTTTHTYDYALSLYDGLKILEIYDRYNVATNGICGLRFDKYKNFYFIANSNIYVMVNQQQTLFNTTYNVNTCSLLKTTSGAFYLDFDLSDNLFISCGTEIRVLSQYDKVMGVNVTKNTVSTLSPGGTSNGTFINSSGISYSGINCTMVFDKETRSKLYISGASPLALRQIINVPFPPSYITITPSTYPSILIGNLQNQPMYLYNGGNTITGYYYSTTNSPSYTFVPITTQESFAITRPTTSPYAVNIMSVNNVGNSRVYTVTVPLAVPGVPSVQANCLSSGSISVTIIPPVDNGGTLITDYDVYYGLINTSISRTPVSVTTGTTYSFSGLSANTYTVYVAAKNTTGWSPYGKANVSVYTTPVYAPIIDPENTISIISGNLTIAITDTQNIPNNGIYYLYSLNGGLNYGNSRVAYNGNTTYQFTVSDTGNSSIKLIANTYSLTVSASNPLSNAVSTPLNVIVYTIPSNAPTIDAGNTVSTTSGNLTVSFTDTSNTFLNNISYVYYLYDASAGTNQFANPLSYTETTKTLVSGVTQYSFRIPNLTNKTYFIYLRAKNMLGVSANSAPYRATVYTTPTNISFDTGNTSVVTAGNLKVTINDFLNVSLNGSYYFYSINGGATYANSNVPNNGPTKTSYLFYIPYNSTEIQTIYVRAQNPVGNSIPIGLNIYSSYNTSLYATSNRFFIDNSTNYTFPLVGFPNKTYDLYLRGKNTIGYSGNSVPYSVTIFVMPSGAIAFNANTRTVASGNLQIGITDTSNVDINNVYYTYSLDGGITYSNSFVKNTGVSFYRFFLGPNNPALDISSTIYVRASNTIGNTSPIIQNFIIQQTPNIPSLFTASLISSGNVLLRVQESSPINNYFLNGVSYYYYVYTEGIGTNNSANISAYTNRIGSLTSSAYPDTTLLLTGLPNASSTFYMIAKNDIGYSNTVSASVTVYTAPSNITFDSENTKLVSSGNVKVVIYDPDNTTSNNVFYRYSIDGTIPSIESNTRKTDGQSYPFFYIDGLDNNTYTISVLAYNSIGNSAVVSGNVISYITPFNISVDASNTRVVSSGNLLIQLNDTENTAKNNVYYWYSLNGSQYINSNVTATTPSTSPYSFYVSGLTDISYSVSVIARNPIGDSTVSTISKIVYTTPVSPTAYTVAFIQSGNIRASFTDINANPNYGANGVSYLYYLYSSGVNQSGNIFAYTSTNIQYSKTVSTYEFNIDKLNANTYTLYLTSKNPLGNSVPLSYTLSVYTNPVPPTSVLVSSNSSGNLQVNIVDLSNTAINDISYYYYLYSEGSVNDSGNIFAYTDSNTRYVSSNAAFYVNGLSANNYTVYVRSKNTLGYSSNTVSSGINVYSTPITPQLDIGNTASTNSGEITVSLFDTSNVFLNNVYYHYSINNGNTYSNSLTRYTGTAFGNRYSYVITGLTNGQPYTIYTIARNVLGNSAPIITPPIIPYSTPSQPTVVATPDDSVITISITPPENNGNAISSYSYSISPQIDTYTNIGIPNNNTYTIGNLQNGTTYVIRIIATNARGNSLPSAPVSAKPFGISGAPFIYATYRNNIIDVCFNTPDSNGSEIINYRYSLNGVFPPTGNVGVPPNNYFSIRYLTIGNTYTLRLHAETSVGLSPPSNAITLTPGRVPDEPIIVNTIPLDGAIEIEVFPGFDGGAEIIGYEYAYIEGFL